MVLVRRFRSPPLRHISLHQAPKIAPSARLFILNPLRSPLPNLIQIPEFLLGRLEIRQILKIQPQTFPAQELDSEPEDNEAEWLLSMISIFKTRAICYDAGQGSRHIQQGKQREIRAP